GLAGFAPGTVGTLVAFPLHALLSSVVQGGAYLAVIALLFAAGVWMCGITATALGKADPGGIVWDEIVAFLWVLYFVPQSVVWYAVAFIAFRVFDVWKPLPISHFDRTLKNGFGVMFDDLLAAIYTVLFVRILVLIS
ncbi:MAG: phosphatidylglycerophosphatase A family protein, partial [Burkholderiales bacterium]